MTLTVEEDLPITDKTMATNEKGPNVTELGKGLNTDFSPQIQPDGTYRFALNTVNEAELGDSMYRSNEEGNEVSVSLPAGYTPIGKKYIGNGDTVLFLVKNANFSISVFKDGEFSRLVKGPNSILGIFNEAGEFIKLSEDTNSILGIFNEDGTFIELIEDNNSIIGIFNENSESTELVRNTNSIIGIFNEEGKFTVLVDDSTSSNKLNFSIEHQIDCIYRLRRGCERTIYFTDDYNPPRYYNIDKSYNFLDTDSLVDADLFKLFRTYDSIPRFSNIEILEEGLLSSGSYNIAMQYIDDDLNPTEWMTVSDTIIIYNDKIGKNYSDIRGSTNAVNSYQNFGPTNKAIRVTVENMDMSFPLYRLALVEANNGSGQITKVTASANLSTKSNIFTFNGNSGVSVITEDEIASFGNSVEKAAHIEQLENRLLLSKVKNKTVDWYKLQSYASKIRTDLVLQEITLNNLIENNPKNGLVHTQLIGYMPGEIYSMGIVYVFDDGSTSPVFHIPGSNPIQSVSSSGAFAMDTDNSCTTAKYTSLSDKCGLADYWGTDSEGQALTGNLIRHHRFPLRSKIGKSLFTKTHVTPLYKTYLNVTGTNPNPHAIFNLTYEIETYSGSGVYIAGATTFTPNDYPAGPLTVKIEILSEEYTRATKNLLPASLDGLDFSLTTEFVGVAEDVYKSEIFGFKFSDIELPDSTITNGHQIVGYYMVRNERTENEKTILDSGVLVPTVKDSKGRFLAHGLLMPELLTFSTLKTDIVGLINPEFKFNKREYKNFNLLQEGYYTPTSKQLSSSITQDVQLGTSYDPTINTSHSKDTDGFDLRTYARNSILEYTPSTVQSSIQVKESFYLNALSSVPMKDDAGKTFEVYNIACDNTVGILSLDDYSIPYGQTKKLPYVLMKRELGENYSTFQTLPYFLETDVLSAPEATVFNGDSYISPMKYHNSIFYDMKLAARGTKNGTWKVITGILIGLAAITVTVLTLGAGVAASVALGTIAAGLLVAGAGILLTTSGLEINNLAKVYNEAYNEGLNEGVEDIDTKSYFGSHKNPISITGDDEIRWFSDTLSDLWFESSVNMSWRKGSSIGLTDFLDAPKNIKTWTSYEADGIYTHYITGDINTYMLNKLTVVDSERNSGRLYKGYAGAEIYEVNLDYFRRNKQKIYFALGIEYDCCSNCSEDFPHRTMYSEQSFQEELTDNYRVFLPNNYRDLDGETGVITNIFKIQNSLFIHTEEGLWNIPKNYQERVTGQIVSFLGTGSYFDIPPQKMVDDSNGNSAGNLHKWGTVKTPYSYFFVCERQGCIYMFNGQKLQAITDNGIKNEMSYRIPMAINEQMPTGQRYAHDDNPSNPIGTGFIATYDSKKDRVIFTKKDFKTIAGITYNKSWTISYSPKNQSFTSWHSYLPSFYINTAQNFFSWIPGSPNQIWKHGSFGKYQNFYDVKHPFIIEMVSKGNPLVNNIWDALHIIAEVKEYSPITKEFYDVDNKFFNKVIFYNSRQCSGELNIVVKDKETLNYIMDQVQNTNMNDIIVSRNERDWSINELRDFRKDYKKPIFKSDDASVQSEYFIDKVVNYGDANSILGFDKDWTELESFRDKYLVIRLIFDNFDNYKLLLNYSIENETQSFR